jgi:hypothetical protein
VDPIKVKEAQNYLAKVLKSEKIEIETRKNKIRYDYIDIKKPEFNRII